MESLLTLVGRHGGGRALSGATEALCLETKQEAEKVVPQR